MIYNRPRRREKKRLTWYFNSKIYNVNLLSGFSVFFTSAEMRCKAIVFRASGRRYIMSYTAATGDGYDVASGLRSNGTIFEWNDQKYRTITFEEEPTGDLLAFLEANATPQ